MTFGTTPTTTTQGVLATNQIPIGSVAEPGRPNGDLTALEGGPGSVDANSNRTAPAAMYVKDGNDVTQGTSTDTNSANTVIGRLTKIRDLLSATLTIAGTTTEANSASINTHLAAIDTAIAAILVDTADIETNTGNIPPLGQALAGSSVPVVLTAAQQTALTPPSAIAGFALEAGHLATIDTSTAASKTDLDTIVTNTNKIPASPAQEAGNLATINTSTAAVNTATGAQADGAVTGDNAGTLSAKLRGLSKMIFDVWDSVNHRIHVNVDNGNANGQTTMSASGPVVIASDQTPVQVKRSTVAVYSRDSTISSGSTGNSGDLTVGLCTEIGIDITTTAQAGTAPTIQFFYERKGAEGTPVYYPLWQSAVLSVAANTISTSIGAGLAYAQSLGLTGRLRWVVGGSATPTFTFSANIYGK